MKGSDTTIPDELYQRTSKSAEGYLAALVFQKSREGGCEIDQDSSAEKSFRLVYGPETSARVMKCDGHVGRSHANVLKELKSRKEFDSGYIGKYKARFPEVENISFNCKGKRHSSKCGCIRNGFIESARRNLFCAITQCGNSAETFAQRMRDLGKYHA